MRQAQNSSGCVCSLEKRSLGFFGFVFDSFLFSSSGESWRTFVVSENYLLLVAFFEFWIDDRESFGDFNPDWTTGFKLFLNEISSCCGTYGTKLLQTEITIMEL